MSLTLVFISGRSPRHVLPGLPEPRCWGL